MAHCPDCHRYEIFSGQGNGQCSHCYGSGERCWSRLNEDLTGTPLECVYCEGSGICQTCGGTGTVEDEEDNEKEEHKNYESGSASYGSDHIHSDVNNNASSYSTTSSSEGSGVGKLVFLSIMVLGLLSFCSILCSKSNNSSNTSSESISERPSVQNSQASGNIKVPEARESIIKEANNPDDAQISDEPGNNQNTEERTDYSSEPSQAGKLQEEIHGTFKSYGNEEKMIRIFGSVIPNNATVKVYVTHSGIRTQYSVVKLNTVAAMCYIELEEQPPESSQYELQFYW
jgi:hypothetical protein